MRIRHSTTGINHEDILGPLLKKNMIKISRQSSSSLTGIMDQLKKQKQLDIGGLKKQHRSIITNFMMRNRLSVEVDSDWKQQGSQL